jgi:hypothetical protein
VKSLFGYQKNNKRKKEKDLKTHFVWFQIKKKGKKAKVLILNLP